MKTQNYIAGLSRMTILTLKYSDDDCFYITHAGPTPDGKYSGWITNLEHRPIVNTMPVFDSPADARAQMKDIISECKKFNLLK